MKVEVFKRTQDDWCPSFMLSGWGGTDLMMVSCCFLGNITAYDPKQEPIWRTCVWGGDDIGMEFDCATEADAWNMFLQIIGMDFVNQNELSKLGFVRA